MALFGKKHRQCPAVEIPEEPEVQWRHEWKYELSAAAAVIIRSRLRAVARPDPHISGGKDGKYRIRSLYFDNYQNRALWEKLDGLNDREKFRIRCYNNDLSWIRLEKKYKRNGLGAKFGEKIDRETVTEILNGSMNLKVLRENESAYPLLRELVVKMRCEGLRPKVIVDYQREPYLFDAGNVRVTFDSDLRASLNPADFLEISYAPFPVSYPLSLARDALNLNRDGKTRYQKHGIFPTENSPLLMEVKWDNFLPSIIQDAIGMPNLPASAFSKYAQCRSFG